MKPPVTGTVQQYTQVFSFRNILAPSPPRLVAVGALEVVQHGLQGCDGNRGVGLLPREGPAVRAEHDVEDDAVVVPVYVVPVDVPFPGVDVELDVSTHEPPGVVGQDGVPEIRARPGVVSPRVYYPEARAFFRYEAPGQGVGVLPEER